MNGFTSSSTNGGNHNVKSKRKDALEGTQPADRKQQSPFKSIKNTLLLRSNKQKKSDYKTKGETFKPEAPKLRKGRVPNGSVSTNRLDSKGQQRLSAQRVTLFKYDHVRVLNSVVKNHRSSSESSTSSTVTSQKSVLRHIDSNDFSPGTSDTRRETCLMSDGPLEIYQIISYTSKAAAQKMTYLCFGRKDNIVHPILPKLQITKLDSSQFEMSILLLNPERYWILTFLPEPGRARLREETKTEFESVVRSICCYKIPPSQIPLLEPSNHSDGQTSQKMDVSGHDDDEDDNDDEDESDLEYLLDDLDSLSDETSFASDGLNQCDENNVNDVFKKAIRNIISLDVSENAATMNNKRLSSYHGPALPSTLRSRYSMVRSVSVPLRPQRSHQESFAMGLGTWMDINAED
ncbi:LADA_0B05996g1_1 [Lachancea dasiensis]|uniref:Inheritance of peroxisomes protein 1 n=1 Tax=Lachancea dasiensis TaxID=1072105 RepID=A0A1G4ITN4_9SACH|nr:LADA_0B05996g1_1 [Lachancea dasiensis]